MVSDKVYAYTLDYDVTTTATSTALVTVTGTGSGMLASTGTPVSAGAKPTLEAIHPSGAFLYVVDSATYTTAEGNKVSYIHTFSIDRNTGALSEISYATGTAAATLYSPTSITVDPLGKFVYVIGTHVKGWQAIAVYTINPATGELTCNGTGVPGAKVMAIEPQGKFAYVGGRPITFGVHKGSVGLTGYRIDQTTGMLTSVMGKVDDDNDPDDDNDDAEVYLNDVQYLTVDLSGQFLYVDKWGASGTPLYDSWGRPFTQPNPNNGEIRIYSINQMSGQIFDTNHPLGITGVANMAISPRTANYYPLQYMYTYFGGYLQLLELDQISGNVIDQDHAPISGVLGVVTEPTGKLVYVFTGSFVKGFAIDPWNGNLQAVGAMATNAGAGGTINAMVFASY